MYICTAAAPLCSFFGAVGRILIIRAFRFSIFVVFLFVCVANFQSVIVLEKSKWLDLRLEANPFKVFDEVLGCLSFGPILKRRETGAYINHSPLA